MLTRRCSERRYFLRPGEVTNQILLYCLAVGAERYGLVVHWFCFLSNHYHAVVTDPLGNRPEFCRWFHQFVAKCLNVELGRWENLWAPEPTSVVALADVDAELGQTVYTLCNPVDAGLVETGDEWPGVRSSPSQFGTDIVVKRPRGYFCDQGPLPEQATLRLQKLPALAHLSDEDYVQRVSDAVAAEEAAIQARMKAEGRTFLGARAVLQQSPFDRPRTHEPRRKMSPRVATRNKWARIEALSRLKAFAVSYRDAWLRFRDGQRDVLFPHGTYWLRVHAGVTCVPG